MKKKLVSVLTVLAMCLSMLPTAAMAYYCDTCVDEAPHDHYCDVCGEISWSVSSEDRTCAAEGCDARESYVKGSYTELTYRMADGIAVADGKVAVYARELYELSMDSSVPAEGSIVVSWEDAHLPVEAPLDAAGEATVEFTGLPVAYLNFGSVRYIPADPEAVLLQENGVVARYDRNLFEMKVDSYLDVTVNGVDADELYFLAGAEVTVTLLVDESAGTFDWLFDQDETDIIPDYEQEGSSICFTMPEGDVHLYAGFLCDNCVDENEDHWCDNCDGLLSDCIDEDEDHLCDLCGYLVNGVCFDEDSDHICDVCWTYWSEWCQDEDGDHACDACYTVLWGLCEDENGDHTCDVCWNLMSYLCLDENFDHYCDDPDCCFWLSCCEELDEDGDGFCAYCGEWIYPDPGNMNFYALAGDTEITMFWMPVPYAVGEDTLKHYIVYCFDEENGDPEDAAEVIVPYAIGADTYTYTFTGLTNDVSYEVGVTAEYTLVDGEFGCKSFTAATSVIPYEAGCTEPGMPKIVSVTCGNGSITVRWKAPQDDGGTRIRGYGIDVMGETHSLFYGDIDPAPNANSVMSYTVEGLTNGERYSVGVFAYNAVGWSGADWVDVKLVRKSSSGGSVDTPVVAPEKTSSAEKFTDLDADAWYYEAANYVLEKGLMAGVGEDTFAPGMVTDRSMIVTILWSLAGKPAAEGGKNFADVEAGMWYSDAIRWASSEGIIAGTGDGTFAPAGGLTREQLATILYSFEKYKGGGFTGAWMFLLNYPDRNEISDWAYEAMCWMTMNQVITGKDGGILDPKGTATRAEVAQMLMRYLEG